LLCKVLDRVVNEIFQGKLRLRSALFEVVQEFEEFSCVLFAVAIAVRLVEELQGLDKDLQAFLILMIN
jgi:hypothetical protein